MTNLNVQHDDVKRCIAMCTDCHQMCLNQALTHCLERGGAHVEAEHLQLMLMCAEICQTSANFMLSGTPLHKVTCRACAEICRACAQSCERVGDMQECVSMCNSCAEHCEQMAKAA